MLGLVATLIAILPDAASLAQVTTYRDVLADFAAGRATVTHTPFDFGDIDDVFDFSPGTLARTNNINPAIVTLTFSEPAAFTSFEVMVAGNDSDITVEGAGSLADLDSGGGSYSLLVPTTEISNETLTPIGASSTPAVRVLRLTVERLRSDDFVHIKEWRLVTSTAITGIEIEPSSFEVPEGGTTQLSVLALGEGGVPIEGLDLDTTWQVRPAPNGAATITQDGLLTGVAPGGVAVRAVADGFQTLATGTVLDGSITDLNVTHIQRLPEYDYDAAKNKPSPGDTDTRFVAHVRQWNGRTLTDVPYAWRIDGSVVERGTIASIAPNEEVEVVLPWVWQAGRHEVEFVIDPDNAIAEETEANNSVMVHSDALLVGFWVERSLYEYFRRHQSDLGVGSNSWEDWAQRQISWWNELNATAIWPTSPEGVLDRVALNKIVLVEDNELPLAGGLATNNPDLRDRTVDYVWGFPSRLLDPNFYFNTTAVSDTNPFYREPSLIHELGHARYLIDHYGFDVFNNADQMGFDAVQIMEGGQPVAGSPLMPFIGSIHLYYNTTGGVMTGPFGMRWSPYEALALNRIAGQRALCGNFNAPCNIGEFLQELPQNNIMRFVDDQGRPLAGAEVEVYQAQPGQRQAYSKFYDDVPDLSFTADCLGDVNLGRNPWGGTRITHNPGYSNGTLIFRIEHEGRVWYRFWEVTEANLAYFTGSRQEARFIRQLEGGSGVELLGDANGDGFVNTEDVVDLLDSLLRGEARADYNGDGSADFRDVIDQLADAAVTAAGC